ncbi:MAG: serine/threonine-protein kinase [Paracoccaceae bacterium]
MAVQDNDHWQSPTSESITPGMLLGPYRVDRLIGRGGMSEVWRAVHETTGLVVALKALHIFFGSDDDRRDIIQREAALSGLRHTAIVRYYDLLETESGRLVLAMDFLEGTDLETACKNRLLDESDAISLLRHLASGLAVAHDAGVVHRDLSPDNIILLGGQIEHPVVIDFGVAVHRVDAAKTIVGGQFAGKFTYAAYEQFEGIADERTDIYALGLVMLFALRGRHTFSSMSILETIEAKKRQVDTEGIAQPLRSVIDRMCAPLPEDRFQSMQDVVAALSNDKMALPHLPNRPMPGDDANLIDGQLVLSPRKAELDEHDIKRVLDTLRFECRNFLEFGGVANTSPILHNAIQYFAETAIKPDVEAIDEVDFGLQVEGLRQKFNYMRASLEAENPERVGFIQTIITVAERVAVELPGWQALQKSAAALADAVLSETTQLDLSEAVDELSIDDDVVQEPVATRLKSLLAHGTKAALFAAISLLSNMARAVFHVLKLTAGETAKALAKTYAAPLSAVAAGSVGAFLLKLSETAPAAFGWLKAWIELAFKLLA